MTSISHSLALVDSKGIIDAQQFTKTKSWKVTSHLVTPTCKDVDRLWPLRCHAIPKDVPGYNQAVDLTKARALMPRVTPTVKAPENLKAVTCEDNIIEGSGACDRPRFRLKMGLFVVM